MKNNIDRKSKSEVEINFEIPWDEFDPFIEKAANELGQQTDIPGFRAGKAPREMVERRIGKEKIMNHALEHLVKEKYPPVVKEEKLEVIGRPQVEVLKLAEGNPVEIRIMVGVMPEVKLPDYKKIASEIKVEEDNSPVSEEDVENTLKQLQKSRANFNKVDRAAKEGDFIEIKYLSPRVEGGKEHQDSFFLGQGKLVPGFEDNLEGMKEGEKKEFSVTFPDDHKSQDNLAGEDVPFTVEMKSVKEAEYPEINDEFAKSLGRFNDLNQLKENIKKGMEQDKKNKKIQGIRNKILEKIASKMDVPPPKPLVDVEKENMLNNMKQRVEEQMGISFNDYLKQIEKTADELKGSFEDEAKDRVKKFLALREVGKNEDIKVSPEEVESSVNKFLQRFPNVEEAKKQIDLDGLRDYHRGAIYNEKVFQRLESFVKKDEQKDT